MLGSTWGTVTLLRDGSGVASYTCSYPNTCPDPSVTNFAKPKLARLASLLQYGASCAGDPTDTTSCDAADAFKATITINYEKATLGP